MWVLLFILAELLYLGKSWPSLKCNKIIADAIKIVMSLPLVIVVCSYAICALISLFVSWKYCTLSSHLIMGWAGPMMINIQTTYYIIMPKGQK